MSKKAEIDFWNQLSMYPEEAGAYTGLGLKAIEILLEQGWLRCMYKNKYRLIRREALDEVMPKLDDKRICLKTRSVVDV